jgi:hypothetical protein
MWLLLLLGVVTACLIALQLGIIPPLTAHTLIQVRNGAVHVRRGRLSPRTVQYVTDILGEHGVSDGYVAITHSRRVAFSRMIPPEIHQQLRNVLLNSLR